MPARVEGSPQEQQATKPLIDLSWGTEEVLDNLPYKALNRTQKSALRHFVETKRVSLAAVAAGHHDKELGEWVKLDIEKNPYRRMGNSTVKTLRIAFEPIEIGEESEALLTFHVESDCHKRALRHFVGTTGGSLAAVAAGHNDKEVDDWLALKNNPYRSMGREAVKALRIAFGLPIEVGEENGALLKRHVKSEHHRTALRHFVRTTGVSLADVAAGHNDKEVDDWLAPKNNPYRKIGGKAVKALRIAFGTQQPIEVGEENEAFLNTLKEHLDPSNITILKHLAHTTGVPLADVAKGENKKEVGEWEQLATNPYKRYAQAALRDLRVANVTVHPSVEDEFMNNAPHPDFLTKKHKSLLKEFVNSSSDEGVSLADVANGNCGEAEDKWVKSAESRHKNPRREALRALRLAYGTIEDVLDNAPYPQYLESRHRPMLVECESWLLHNKGRTLKDVIENSDTSGAFGNSDIREWLALDLSENPYKYYGGGAVNALLKAHGVILPDDR